jgi:hypothetical protein
MTVVSTMAAMIFNWPPQFGQCSLSISKMRLTNQAELMSDHSKVRDGAVTRRSGRLANGAHDSLSDLVDTRARLVLAVASC